MSLTAMSLEEKIGQLLYLGLPRHSADERFAVLDTLRPGGIILFARDFGDSLEQTVEVLNSYRQRCPAGTSMFVGVDHEGGRVSRLPASWATRFHAAAVVGQRTDITSLAKALGTELAALGINMNFAPVLDVHSNPDNPVIGDRSFGSTADAVSSAGYHFMCGLKESGIIPVIKHFPGHGDTAIDSHLALAVVTAGLELLHTRELIRLGEPLLLGHQC